MNNECEECSNIWIKTENINIGRKKEENTLQNKIKEINAEDLNKLRNNI